MTELSGWTKKLQSTSQSQTCTKNSHGHCLLVCYLSDPLQLSESWWNYYIWEVCKSRRCTENCNACSWHWSIERGAYLFYDNFWPHVTQLTVHSWMNWAMNFYFICHIHLTSLQPTTTSSGISMTFCGENASTTSSIQKILSKSSLNPEAWIFMLQE